MDRNTIGGIIVLVILNSPIFYFLGKSIFTDKETFWECVKFWLTPDIFSWFRGQYWEDQLAQLRLGLWLFLCGGLVYGEFWVITNYLT